MIKKKKKKHVRDQESDPEKKIFFSLIVFLVGSLVEGVFSFIFLTFLFSFIILTSVPPKLPVLCMYVYLQDGVAYSLSDEPSMCA